MLRDKNHDGIDRPNQLAAYKWIWIVALIAFLFVVGILVRRGLGPRSTDSDAGRKGMKIEKFTSTNGPVSDEVIPSKLTQDQEISLNQVTDRSDAEMLGLVGNMSTEQRRMLAMRLSQTRGNLVKISMFFKAWAGIDSLAAFQATMNFQNVSQRENALLSVFQGTDAAKAAQLVDQLRLMKPGLVTPDLAQELLGIGLGKWSKVDPQSAADFLSHYGDRNSIDQTIYRQVAKNWGTQDPKAALAWRDQQDSVLQQSVSAGIFQGWAETHPQEALQYAKAHVTDGLEGEVDASMVADTLAANDPSAAQAFVTSLPPGSGRTIAAVSVGVRMAHDDPAGAAGWVNGLPIELQADAAGAVASQYAPQDPKGALAWISTLSGYVQDNALSVYALNVRNRADGMASAFTITDDTKRSETVSALAQQWNQIDPIAFRQWLSTSGLPPETQQSLLPGQ